MASSDHAHAEGLSTVASAYAAHAEGNATVANGFQSHAEGYLSRASGFAAHAEGDNTEAKGDASHAEGLGTIASGSHQHVQGKYNLRNNNFSLFVIGDGTGDSNAARGDIVRVNPGSAIGRGRVEVTGSLAATLGLSGSLTRLVDGTPYLLAGAGVSITSSSNGPVTIAINSDVVTTARTISTTNGLQGGGDLSANRTLSPVYGTTANTVCQGNDSRLSDARTPTSHAESHQPGGSDRIKSLALNDGGLDSPSLTFNSDLDTGLFRAGNNSIGVSLGGVDTARLAPATTSVAGFMSAADKTKLDAIYGERGVSANTTLTTTDRIVRVDTSGGNRTLTLPSPSGLGAGVSILIKKTSTSANTITLARNGSEQIEGTAASYLLPGSDSAGRPAWLVWSDGTNWWVA